MEVKKILDTYGREGLIILEYVLNLPKSKILRDKFTLSEEEESRFRQIAAKRESGMPLQYAIGLWNFFGRDFLVGENVLIPRPETELLVERILKEAGAFSQEKSLNLGEKKAPSLLDLCTGSGIIGITCQLEGNFSRVLSTDISEPALALAEKNRDKFKANIEFRKSDLFEDIDEKFDFISANPPYIESRDLDYLEEDVKKEPLIALDGGEDGLDFYRKIIKASKSHLNSKGYLFFEIGYGQAKKVSTLLEAEGYGIIEIIVDYNGIDRHIVARNLE